MDEGARTSGPKGRMSPSMPTRMAKFVSHLARDPRIPWMAKAAVLGLGVYIVWPADLIPDWLPWIGVVDDLLMISIVMNYVFAVIPEDILIEHWGEDLEPLPQLAWRHPRGGAASA